MKRTFLKPQLVNTGGTLRGRGPAKVATKGPSGRVLLINTQDAVSRSTRWATGAIAPASGVPSGTSGAPCMPTLAFNAGVAWSGHPTIKLLSSPVRS